MSVALPQVLICLLSGSISIISMYLTSLAGHDALSAGALISSTYSFLIMIAFTCLYSIGFTTSQKFGERKKKEITFIIHNGLVLATLLSVPLILIMRNIFPILILLKQPIIISKIVSKYFFALSYGILPSLYGMVLSQFLMGIFKARITIFFSIITVIISTVLGYSLLLGKFGLPSIGIIGVAYSIVFASWFSFFLFGVYLYSVAELRDYVFNLDTNISTGKILNIFNKGWPISIQQGTEILALTMITYLIGTLGQQALAAQQITLQASLLSVMVTTGMSQATAVLIAKSYGMKDFSLGRRYYIASILMGMLFNVLTAFIFILFPKAIISLFLDVNNRVNEYIVQLASTLLFIVGFTRIVDGIRNITTSALRGYGDLYFPMCTAILSCWFIAMPTSFILKNYYGVVGIRLGLGLGIIFGAVILVKRFFKLVYDTDRLASLFN